MQWIKSHRWQTVILTVLLIIVIFVFYTDLHLLLIPPPDDFDSALIQDMKAAKVPGAAILFIRDGQIESAKGYGLADLQTERAVTPDTLFTIASLSKSVTATALMTLYEQGKFSLDDSIAPYLPFEIRNPNFPDMPITFRMLLSHTSSIQDSDVYIKYYTLQKSPVLPDSPIPLGEFIKDYLSPDGKLYNAKDNFIQDAPGSTYKYSNIAFGLVGYLTERISGMPFDIYCKQAIFRPLGMDHTAWYFKDVDTGLMAVPYGYDNLLRRPKPYGFYGYPTYPDGALKTSVNEFARFLSVFINEGTTFEGKPFLKAETVKEMLNLHQFPGLDVQDSVGLAWHSRGGYYYLTGGDPGMMTMTIFSPSAHQGSVIFTNGGDNLDILAQARQDFFANEAMSLLMTRMTAPWFFLK